MLFILIREKCVIFKDAGIVFIKTWIRFANAWIRIVVTNPDSKKVPSIPYDTNPGFVLYRG
jgi:hypothetical protein